MLSETGRPASSRKAIVFGLCAAIVLLTAAAVRAEPDIQVRRIDDAVRGQLTPIAFSLRGAYEGDIEIFQVDSVKYLLRVEQGAGSSAEYEVAVPAVFDHVEFTVRAGDASGKAEPRLMGLVSGLNWDIPSAFGGIGMNRSTKLRVIMLVFLQILCVWALTRVRSGTVRVVSLAVATSLFAAGAFAVLSPGVEEVSVTLWESEADGAAHSLEIIGVGCAWGSRAEVVRPDGLLFPIHAAAEGLFRDALRIRLEGKGSSIKNADIPRGGWRILGCLSEVGSGFETTEGGLSNMTGLDLSMTFMLKGDEFYDLGPAQSGAILVSDGAAAVSEGEILKAASKELSSPAVGILKWRMAQLDSGVVLGLRPPSDIVVCRIPGNDRAQ